MTKMYIGIDKHGIQRVWGMTREECELARKEYLAEQSKIWKPSASHMQIKILKEEEYQQLDELESIELVKLALLFTQNNSDEFFKTRRMKLTTYEQFEFSNLVNNYINSNKLSLK